MKNVKNMHKVWSLLVLALLCCALLIGCESGGDTGVSEIFVQKADMPRLTQVQGQELDLTGGVLTAVVDGTPSPVPMNAEGVTVTGYNKDQLGKQTLTITYQGKTTTIDITVVARATAEGFETNYFVGDTYDNSKGKIKVIKDDGDTVTVNLNSEGVALKSFDSSKAGKATITVTYDGYECAFEVTVHDVANIRLTSPKKTKYVSHETELSLAGGYLTVEAASPSTFSKFIPLTAEMVSGYDPSQMTFETRDQVLKQTITINYSGKQASYEVEIAYSDVHLVQYLAQQLAHLDWNGETLPELTETESNNAIEAMEAYLAMTPLEQSSISEEQLHQVLFPATLALRFKYLTELQGFADAFVIDSAGYLTLTGKSYDAMDQAAKRLENADDPFNQYAEILTQINEAYGDVPVNKGKISDLIIAHNSETAQQLVDMFRYMMNLHDLLKDIPNDWTVETLEQNDVAVANVISKILIGPYQGLSYNDIYTIISSWRPNNDFCDIIYTYFTYIKVSGMDELKRDGLWQVMPLPGPLNDWYVNFMKAVQMEQFMMQNESADAYLYDTAGFMYYYFKTIECAEKIKASDNQLHQNLYRLLEFDALFEGNLRCGPRGYLYQMGQGLDSENVVALWDQYLVIVDKYLTKSTANEEYTEAVKAVLAGMVELSPSELYAFLCSMNFLYDSARGTVNVLDCVNRVRNTLVSLVAGYYYGTLPETVFPCFADLMLAMENYALCGVKETALEDFKTIMERMTANYQALNAEDKATFDTYLGAGYSKYLSIYNRIGADKSVDQGQWEVKMEQLLTVLRQYDEVMSLVLSGKLEQEEKSRVMPVVMAMYEKATVLYNELMAAGVDVRQEMVTRNYTEQGVAITLDRYYAAARKLFVSFMLSAGITTDTGASYMLWDLYGQSAIRPLLARMVDLLWAEYKGQVYEGQDVGNLMLDFRMLKPAEKNTFFILGINQVYYAALERYFCSANESLSQFVPALLRAEIAYAVHQNVEEEATMTSFKEAFEKAKAYYEALENKDQVDVNIRQMYVLYEQAYKDLSK